MNTINIKNDNYEIDKKLFNDFWNLSIYSDELKKQIIDNYLIPVYGCDNPAIIFDCGVSKLD